MRNIKKEEDRNDTRNKRGEGMGRREETKIGKNRNRNIGKIGN